MFQTLHGKELSYNNIVDIAAAARLVSEFNEPTVAIIKHTNPCGAASASTLSDAARRAFEESFDLGEFLGNTVRRTYMFFLGYSVNSWDHSAVKVAVKRASWLAFFLSLAHRHFLGKPTMRVARAGDASVVRSQHEAKVARLNLEWQ